MSTRQPTHTVTREAAPWARRLERLMRLAGYSQTRLAAEAGLQKASVNQWFSGAIQQIKGENLLVVCRILKTTPEYILYGDEQRSAETKPSEDRPANTRQALVEKLFAKLTPTQQMEELYRLHNLTEMSVDRGRDLIRMLESDGVHRSQIDNLVIDLGRDDEKKRRK